MYVYVRDEIGRRDRGWRKKEREREETKRKDAINLYCISLDIYFKLSFLADHQFVS